MSGALQVAVVGGGPRGLAVLERLVSNAAALDRRLRIHLIDSAQAGSGAVWRPDQCNLLLTNTVAGQITVFPDDSSVIDGPIVPGPSLHEWAATLDDDDPVHQPRRLGPNSYPPRAVYGRYLCASLERVLEGASEHVEVVVHRARAVALADTDGVPGGPQGVRLVDGTRLHGLDAVVLALGHLPTRPDAAQARIASLARIHHLAYLPPANPADVDLDVVAPGSTVLLRGLGLNFFDYMALLSAGRGGRFERDDAGALRYLPSGREPRMVASSRRGIPFHARGENQKGVDGRHHPLVLTPRRLATLPSPADFDRDIWPLVDREVQLVFHAALVRRRGGDGDLLARELAAAESSGARDLLLDAAGIEPGDRWSWEAVQGMGRTEFADRDAFRASLLRHLRADVVEAKVGNVDSPVKAALDALRDLRNEIRLAVEHGGLGVSQARLDGWYTPMNAFLSIGPPVERIEQMVALVEAGLLELTGPGSWVRFDSSRPAFLSGSSLVPGPVVEASTLIECRLPEPDVRRCADPLVTHLLETEQATSYDVVEPSGERYRTGGLAVTRAPYRVLLADDRVHPRRFAFGVPTEGVHWVTAAGVRPGVDSVTIKDADSIARAVLGLSRAEVLAAARRGEGRPAEPEGILV